MARGKQLDEQTVYNIMALYSIENNCQVVADKLKMPVTTVRTIVKKNCDKPEFVELRSLKKAEFSGECSAIISLLLQAAKKKVEMYLTDDDLLANAKMTEITTSIGTLYDKRALNDGESTDNITFTIPDEVKKYAE